MVDWALNVGAAREPDAIASFLDAATAVREGGGDAHAAIRRLRDESGRLSGVAQDVAAEGGHAIGSQVASLTARLNELARSPDAGDQLRAGVLGSSPVETVDPFGLATPAEAGRPARAARGAKP